MRQPPSIDSYGGGGFRVSGVWRPGSLMILGDIARDWSPHMPLTLDDFALVIAHGPAVSEFVLLGTGANQARPSPAIRDALRAAGIGLEFMSTANAARTYNVLAAQGRRIAAGLVAV